MVKIYTKEVVTCISCPVKKEHPVTKVPICIQVGKVLSPKDLTNKIPKWCPLPDKPTKKKYHYATTRPDGKVNKVDFRGL
jgi:hypothetical protein